MGLHFREYAIWFVLTSSFYELILVGPEIPILTWLTCLQVTEVPHDERPLPTLQSPAEQRSPLCDTQMSPNSLDVSGEPEPLSEMAQRQASLAVEVFGESLVRKKGQLQRCLNVLNKDKGAVNTFENLHFSILV